MQVKALMLALLVACSPTYRAITHRCPTTTMVIDDALVSIAAFVVAGFAVSGERWIKASAAGAIGAGVIVGANIAEVGCVR